MSNRKVVCCVQEKVKVGNVCYLLNEVRAKKRESCNLCLSFYTITLGQITLHSYQLSQHFIRILAWLTPQITLFCRTTLTSCYSIVSCLLLMNEWHGPQDSTVPPLFYAVLLKIICAQKILSLHSLMEANDRDVQQQKKRLLNSRTYGWLIEILESGTKKVNDESLHSPTLVLTQLFE